MSTEVQPWPMGFEMRAGFSMESPFDSMTVPVAMIAIDAQAYWRCHELDRAALDQRYELSSREVMCIVGEFIERFGYDAAKRFVQEVLHRPENSTECEFLELRTNLEQRFGPRGLLYTAAMLAAERAITGREPIVRPDDWPTA